MDDYVTVQIWEEDAREAMFRKCFFELREAIVNNRKEEAFSILDRIFSECSTEKAPHDQH